MPRRWTNIDDLRTLNGFQGYALAIWEFQVGGLAQRDQIVRALRDLSACAIVRSGLGIWVAIVDGTPLPALYRDRDGAIAAVDAARMVKNCA